MTRLTPTPAPRVQSKQLTEEQKKMQVVKFLSQKREQYALNILCNLCRGLDKKASSSNAKSVVDLAVEMADHLMEKLYPGLDSESDKSNE